MNISTKIIIKKINIIIPAQKATMSPPVGPILGQLGIKIKTFCDQFNKDTLIFPINTPLNVLLFVYKDSTFLYKLFAPSISIFFNNFLKNYSLPLLVYKIALIKKKDYPFLPLVSIIKNIISTYYARTK